MNEKELQVFIESTVNYFDEITGEKASMGVPYIKENSEEILLEYTGAIGISGARKGAVYITTPKEMLSELVIKILGDESPDHNSRADMVGEIANTIAGNARNVFGSNFMISVPIVLEGHKLHIKLQIPTFVIPIKWRHYTAYLVIGIEG